MAGILRLIEAERQGTSVDRTLCHELLRMLSSLGIYESSFQEPFLEDSAAFYEAEGLSRLHSSDVPEYLLHCEVRHGLDSGKTACCLARRDTATSGCGLYLQVPGALRGAAFPPAWDLHIRACCIGLGAVAAAQGVCDFMMSLVVARHNKCHGKTL